MGLIKDNNYVTTVCKPGHGSETCRYLTMGVSGWECEKLTQMKRYFDTRVARNAIVAQGDNCAGR